MRADSLNGEAEYQVEEDNLSDHLRNRRVHSQTTHSVVDASAFSELVEVDLFEDKADDAAHDDRYQIANCQDDDALDEQGDEIDNAVENAYQRVEDVLEELHIRSFRSIENR